MKPNKYRSTNNTKIIVSEIEAKNTYIFDKSKPITPESPPITNKIYHADRSNATKLYTSATNRKLISNLETNAKCLLLWLLFNLESNKEIFAIDKIRYMKENNIKSIRTITRAINNLIQNNLIQFTEKKDIYYINPNIAFAGNRSKVFSDNVIIYKCNK